VVSEHAGTKYDISAMDTRDSIIQLSLASAFAAYGSLALRPTNATLLARALPGLPGCRPHYVSNTSKLMSLVVSFPK
jgi:hypothetical protein